MPTRILFALLTVLVSACVQTPVRKLPAFEHAVKIAPKSKTKCVEASSLDIAALPALVPYALLSAQSDFGTVDTAKAMISNLSKLGQPPDLLMLQVTGRAYTGSVYSGGLSGGFSIPMYQNTTSAIAYRTAPARLGIQWDASGMVIGLDEAAKPCGILEGDRIVSFAGSPVSLGEEWAQSAHYVKVLDLKPGDEIEIVWIRPGTGRMSGKAKLIPNTSMPPNLPCLDLETRPMKDAD